jgi:hypothetical protein|tara:strand:- start:143 stop:331 length:189 start_codon:yes stop_codon:yes gene_type:complete
MNQSLVLLLCLSPLATIFIVMKFAVWISEATSYRSKTQELKKMQHGPYEIWDYEDEEADDWQ